MTIHTIFKQAPYDATVVNQLQEKYHLTPTLARLLNQRHITNVVTYFQRNESHDGHDLHDMKQALTLLHQAKIKQQRIIIYGDYDVDGMTSTALLYSALRTYGCDVSYYVPDRHRDGYGLTLANTQRIVKAGYQVLITVDNGITCNDAITYAHQHHITTIITDHHHLDPNHLPPADATVHPLYPNHEYVQPILAGVGVVYKLVQCLLPQFAQKMLWLVMLGTIADVMPLTGENRMIVTKGLQQIHDDHVSCGLSTLIDAQGLDYQHLTSSDIGYKIAPCLNALGRIGNSRDGVRLLLSDDQQHATYYANNAITLNDQRRQITKTATEEAIQQLNDHHQINILVSDHWKKGIVGLIANNIMNLTDKPTLCLTKHGDYISGSGRAPAGYDLYHLLHPYLENGLLHTFGGHAQACGLSLKATNLTKLQRCLDHDLTNQTHDIDNIIYYDYKCDEEHLIDACRDNYRLQPTGTANPAVRVITTLTVENARHFGANQQVIQLDLHDDNPVRCVGFDFPNLDVQPHDQLTVYGECSINWFNQHAYPQLIIRKVIKQTHDQS